MKKVISYALFGEDNTRYAPHIPAVIRAHLALYPLLEGWVLRIHHDQHIYSNEYGGVLHGLQERGLLELRYMGHDVPLCKAMLWRMAPLFDEDVDVVFCRDIDALPMPREKACMEEFLASDANIHALHDSPYHDGVMGGMCGFKKGAVDFKNLEDLYLFGGDVNWHSHGVDQEVLNRMAVIGKVLTQKAPPADNDPRDHLANHIGSAGFDADDAVNFYDNEVIDDMEQDDFFIGAPQRHVVLASDLDARYSFFLPLTCYLWRRLHWHRPLVLLVGTPEAWLANPRSKLSLDRTRAVGAKIHFLGDFEGHLPSTVAQVARLCAATVAGDGDYLLTSDVDMWPVGPWPGSRRNSVDKVQLYFANAYTDAPDLTYPAPLHFPMCYIGASGKTWREIMNLGPVDTVRSAVTRMLAHCSASKPDHVRESDWTWNFDEIHFGHRLAQWPGYPTECELINRNFNHPGERRIDRSAWNVPSDVSEIADAHLLRPGFNENWNSLRPLLEKKLNAKWLAWADDYRKEYNI